MFASSQILLTEPVKPVTVKLCPTINLVAAISGSHRIEAFRFDGSQAFSWDLRTSKADSGISIESIAWQSNGLFLSVLWSDDRITYVDTRTGHVSATMIARSSAAAEAEDSKKAGRIVSHSSRRNLVDHSLLKGVGSGAQRSTVPPSASSSDAPQINGRSAEHRPSTSLEDFTGLSVDPALISSAQDLPRRLATIDLLRELPQLSPLPHIDDKIAFGSYEPNVLNTQSDIDAAFPSQDQNDEADNIVDFTVPGWGDGAVTFVSPSLRAQRLLKPSGACSSILHATHVFSSCHAFLASADDATGASRVSLTVYSLRSLRESSFYFHFIPRYVMSLDNLARYVLHCIAGVRQAYKATQELPSRFLSFVKDDLEASDRPWALDAAFYHQAVTGDCHPVIKDWLVNSLQDRGHKRWDAAVAQGYSDVVKLVHTFLLPALERASVVASRLRGISQAQPSHALFDVQPRHLTRIMHNLDILRMLSHQVLTYASSELSMFHVFSEWLGEQITLHRAEPDSPTAKETLERVAGLDYSLLLDYIEGPLLSSHLNYFLGRDSQEITEASRRPAEQWSSKVMTMVLEKHGRESTQPKPRSEGGATEATNLLWQGFMLQDSVRDVRNVPNEDFEKEIDHVEDVPLDSIASATADREIGLGVHDMRMVVEDPEADVMCTYIAQHSPGGQSQIHLQRVLHSRFLEALQTPEAPSKVKRLPTLQASSPRHPQTRAAPGTLIALRLVTDDLLLALYQGSTSQPSLQLWACAYGRAAGASIDGSSAAKATASPASEHWDPDWTLVREWATDDGFEPRVGGVEARLAPGGAALRVGSIVLCVLARECDRVLAVEVGL